jgi:hypothetical protein
VLAAAEPLLREQLTLVANSPDRRVWKERISRQGAKHAKKSAILW